MRGRGDLAGFAGGTADEGATATDSVAACICGGLRRQYAIESLPSRAGLEAARFTMINLVPFSSEAAPFWAAKTLDFGHPGAV